MKLFSPFCILVVLLLLTNVAKPQEHYFRLIEPNSQIVNTIITQSVSIDNVVGDTVYAYASLEEYEIFKSLGFTIQELPYPSVSTKGSAMALSISEIANWDRYPTYEVYREMMKLFEKNYPTICKLDSIGTTVEGRKLYVVKISDNVLEDEAEPELFYTSTMHGDETTGYILMLRLIDYLLTNYESDNRVAKLVNGISIYINPNANPDGTYYGGNHTVNQSRRYNANNKDINRNFPDPRAGNNPGGTHQPETIAMMDFAENRDFVLSANFHGGIELANFPWDTWQSTTNQHADHNWFNKVCRQYANYAQANSPSGYFTGQDNGVTHGGDWYVVAGGRQDYMNYWHHCRETTFEISNTKTPDSNQLPNFWNYNKESMLSYMELALTGIQGIVSNSSGEPLFATISIEGHDKDNSEVSSSPAFGNYTRLIDAGTWDLTFSAENYKSQTHTISLSTYTSLVTKNVVLKQIGQNDVSIEVKHNTEPVANASVKLNQFTQSTGDNGKAHFTEVTSGQYSLIVEADGFNVFEQEVLLESDTTLTITLIPAGIFDENRDLPKASIWPNPFTDKIYIQVGFRQQSTLQIDILSISGQKVTDVINTQVNPGLYSYCWIPEVGLPEGIYIVRIRNSRGVTSHKILFTPHHK